MMNTIGLARARRFVLGLFVLIFLPLVAPLTAQQPGKEKPLPPGRVAFLKSLQEQEANVKKLTADLGADHPDTMKAKMDLCFLLASDGQIKRGYPLMEEVYVFFKAKKSLEDRNFLFHTERLAFSARELGKYDRALELFEILAQFAVEKRRDEPREVEGVLRVLTQMHLEKKNYDKAVAVYEKALARLRADKAEDTALTCDLQAALIGIHRQAGKTELAFTLSQDLLDRHVKVHGKDGFVTGSLHYALGEEFTKRNQHDKALVQFQAAEVAYGKTFGADSEHALVTRNRVALAYQALGQFDKALPLFDTTVAKFREQKGRSAQGNLLAALGNAAACYEMAKKLPEAEKLRREVVETQRKVAGPEAAGTAGALAWLGLNLLNQEKWRDAEPILRECLEIRQKQAPNDWRTANARSLLGAALLGQKKYADAEPLLKEGYEGLQKLAAEIPPEGKDRPTEALERLARLYEATDRKDEAAALRKKREETKKAMP